MKVLIIRNAFTHDFGGAERLAVNIAHELNLNQIESVVVSRQPRLLAFAETQNVIHRRGLWWSRQNWSGKNALLYPVYLIWQLVLLIWYIGVVLRIRPDVVHVFSKDDFIAGTFAAKLLRKRVVWTDCADLKHVFLNHGIWYKNPVGKLVYLASKLADKITLVSESEERLITDSIGHGLSKNFTVMHIAGKDEAVKPRGRTANDRHAVIFCATSRLVEAKGILELVQAFNKLSEHSKNYRLWLVGNGPDEQRFKTEAGDNPYINFVGHSDEPLRYVAESDVFVHPTYHEGFSLSLAEAAMLGKPMIATNIGGNPELVNHTNGILVPVKEVDALHEAMEKLGEDAVLRQKLGAQARHDYTTKFDFSTVVKTKLIPMYE